MLALSPPRATTADKLLNRVRLQSKSYRSLTLTLCCTDTTRADLLDELAEQSEKHQPKIKVADLRQLLYRAAGHLVKADKVSYRQRR